MKLSKSARVGTLGVVASVIAFIFIMTQIDANLFAQAWREARYGYLLPCVVLLLLGLVARAQRWRALLADGLPLGRAFSIMNIAYLVNGVLPLRLGEVARVALVARVDSRVTVPQTIATIIVERLLDLLAVVILLSLALIVGSVPQELRLVGASSAALALLGFGLLIALAMRPAWAQNVLSWLIARLSVLQRWPLARWLDQFLEGLQPLAHPMTLFIALTWTTLAWALSVWAGYVLMYALYDRADLATTALYIAAAAFAIALPAVPGNVGTYEASILLALTAMGYAFDGRALAFAVLVHAVNVFVHVSTGIVGFMAEGLSWDQFKQTAQTQSLS
ncbi:MAG: flippase-like domain-containing protein [Anaerolineae bacterium]|nr:flippase-like domain-containing protein [Anaerolineae bacterium]MDW8171502.1 lysylphosphatidylglycerol synthase transmembrane domain-containing protein [Anaerolineae bacterium]